MRLEDEREHFERPRARRSQPALDQPPQIGRTDGDDIGAAELERCELIAKRTAFGDLYRIDERPAGQ